MAGIGALSDAAHILSGRRGTRDPLTLFDRRNRRRNARASGAHGPSERSRASGPAPGSPCPASIVRLWRWRREQRRRAAAVNAPQSRSLYFSHPSSLGHDPSAELPWVPETPGRIEALERRLGELAWLGWERRTAGSANESQIGLIHSARYIEFVRETAAGGGGAADAETWIGEDSYRAALHAAGAACEMTHALLGGETRRGFCGVRPPGHHAERDRAMGFCLFNNVAIAAELAIAELGAERVFILDWDVHHGNGTAEAFRYRNDVLFASIHRVRQLPRHRAGRRRRLRQRRRLHAQPAGPARLRGRAVAVAAGARRDPRSRAVRSRPDLDLRRI